MPKSSKLGFTTQPYMLKPVHAPHNYDPNNNMIRQQSSANQSMSKNDGTQPGNSPAGDSGMKKSY